MITINNDEQKVRYSSKMVRSLCMSSGLEGRLPFADRWVHHRISALSRLWLHEKVFFCRKEGGDGFL